MDNVKLTDAVIENDSVNEDGHKLTFVDPQDLIDSEEKLTVLDTALKDNARDILQTQDHEKKASIMLTLKTAYPDLKLSDFVRDYIGVSNVEGCNYEVMANSVEDHFFKNFGKKIGSTFKKATDKVKSTADKTGSSIGKFFSKGGFIDKTSRSIDKVTGGLYHKVNAAKKKVMYSIPVVGDLAKQIDTAIYGAKKTGKVDAAAIKKDIETDQSIDMQGYSEDDLANMIAATAATVMASEGQPTQVVGTDRSFHTVQKNPNSQQTMGGIKKEYLYIGGAALAAIVLLKK